MAVLLAMVVPGFSDGDLGSRSSQPSEANPSGFQLKVKVEGSAQNVRPSAIAYCGQWLVIQVVGSTFRKSRCCLPPSPSASSSSSQHCGGAVGRCSIFCGLRVRDPMIKADHGVSGTIPDTTKLSCQCSSVIAVLDPVPMAPGQPRLCRLKLRVCVLRLH